VQTRIGRSVAGVESRQRRWRSTSTGAVERQLGHDPSSGWWTEHRLDPLAVERPPSVPSRGSGVKV
jgi:hypothetical protein